MMAENRDSKNLFRGAITLLLPNSKLFYPHHYFCNNLFRISINLARQIRVRILVTCHNIFLQSD